jgi:hypothetical protein
MVMAVVWHTVMKPITSTADDGLAMAQLWSIGVLLTPTSNDEGREEPCLGHQVLVCVQNRCNGEQNNEENGRSEIWVVAKEFEISSGVVGHDVCWWSRRW